MVGSTELTLYVGWNYYHSVTSSIENGPVIRNKSVLRMIYKKIREKGFNISFKRLARVYPMRLDNIPIYTFHIASKRIEPLQPLSFYILSKVKPKILVSSVITQPTRSLLLLHYYFDLIAMELDDNIPAVVELPDLISETAGYKSRYPIGINCLHHSFIEMLKKATAITITAKRDLISLKQHIPSKKIFLIHNVFPNSATMRWENIMSHKEDAIAIAGWGDWRHRLKLALTIAKHSLPYKKLYVLNSVNFKLARGNIELIGYSWLDRNEWLHILSKTKFFIFSPKIPWKGGHSVRYNDAALTGNVILGGEYELRDMPYPHSYTYLDEKDLVVKLEELSSSDPVTLGYRNWLTAMERSRESERTVDQLVEFVLGLLT